MHYSYSSLHVFCFPLIQFYFCINLSINLVVGYGLIHLPPIKLKYMYVFLYSFTIPQNSTSWFLDPEFLSIVIFLFCDDSTSIAKYLESIRNILLKCADLTLTPSYHYIRVYHFRDVHFNYFYFNVLTLLILCAD